jgi:hypothetical protein
MYHEAVHEVIFFIISLSPLAILLHTDNFRVLYNTIIACARVKK